MNCALNLPGVQRYFAIVSNLGNGKLWYWLMLILPWSSEVTIFLSLHLLLVGLAGVLLYKACKHITKRPRPYLTLEDILLGACPLDQYSFPSGHTMHAVSFSLVIVECCPHLAIPIWFFTLSVALSRVILGLHYPTDVFLGAGFGFLLGNLSLKLRDGLLT
jgi:undecaprenyl-diphosphatase